MHFTNDILRENTASALRIKSKLHEINFLKSCRNHLGDGKEIKNMISFIF